MSDVLEELRDRCEAAGLYFEEWGDWGGGQDLDSHDSDPARLMIQFSEDGSATLTGVEDGPEAEWLAKEPFERYRVLSGFAASWSEEQRIVECSLGNSMNYLPISGPAQLKQVLKRLGQAEAAERHAEAHQRIQFDSDIGLSISVGPCSNMHSFLYGRGADSGPGEGERVLSLQIGDVEVTTDDAAREILQRVANSLLFQLDLTFDLPLILQRKAIGDPDYELSKMSRLVQRHLERREAVSPLPPVRFEYDRQPMSLYWYGKAASTMPLLQFLAYYQVMEFYFPVYSRRDAQTTLQHILKDPTFNPMRDADVARLLDAIKVGSGGRAFGNEAEQLEATIRHCVSAEEMQNFLMPEDEARYKFYTSKEAKKLTGETFPIRQKADDLRNIVARRINAIRNRIVHTKGTTGRQEPLFPFDPETQHLGHDIDLVEFLAQKVLIASSQPLRV